MVFLSVKKKIMKMIGIFQTVALLGMLSSHTIVSGAESEVTIVEHASACNSERQLTLTCPDDHYPILKTAVYFKSLEPGCNRESQSICEQENVRDKWFDRCYESKQKCDINLRLSSAARPCNGYAGNTFIKATYRCEIRVAENIDTLTNDMCSMNTVWAGSLLYLHSPQWPRYTLSDTNSNCGCTVSVLPNIELEINLSDFASNDEDAEDCDQKFMIQSAGDSRQVCSEHHVRDFVPIDMEFASSVHFKFETIAGEAFKYLLVVQVHHAQNASVQCWKDYTLPEISTTAAPTPLSTDAGIDPTARGNGQPQRSANKASSEVPWPIITGVVGVVCVLLIVGVVVLLFCRKKGNKKRNGSNTDLAFENHVYVNAEQTSSSTKPQTVININDADSKDTISSKVSNNMKSNFSELNQSKPTKQDKTKEELSAQSETNDPYANDTWGTVKDQSNTKKYPSLWKDGSKTFSELKEKYPDIPESVLKDINSQSETTITINRPNVFKGNGKSGDKLANDTTPRDHFDRDNANYSSLSNTGTSVKDRAKMLNSSASFSVRNAKDQANVDISESDVDVTPYSSMGDLSVKDRAKLMAQQLKTAKK